MGVSGRKRALECKALARINYLINMATNRPGDTAGEFLLLLRL